jgi:hypothetical protein
MERTCGEALGAGPIKHRSNGLVFAERIVFRIVQLQKARAGGGQCRWSQCMSYMALRPGGKERRGVQAAAIRKGVGAQDG